MKAAQITAYGGPEAIEIVDIDPPVAGAGQVLVRVAAVGINPFDWKLRNGWLAATLPMELPVVSGNEFSGTIAQLGADVTGFDVGDEIHGVTGFIGAFAEIIAVPASSIAHKPASLSLVDAAAVPVAAVTAEAELDAGQVGRGTRVLIHAAAGGVGIFAVQLAVERGAKVTALGSAGNLDFLKSLGAQQVVDRSTDYSSIGEFDVVLDNYGPAVHASSAKLLKKGGRLISIAGPVDEELLKERDLHGEMVFGGANGAMLAKVDALIDAGKLKILVERTWPFAEVQDAMRESERGVARGKLVVTLDR